MKDIYLFAYGSMKKEFRNHYRLENDILIGEALTKEKYNMYPAPNYNYPYAIEKDKKWKLHGELYKVKESDIKEIDEFEGTPHYYYRKVIEIECNGKVYKSFIYFKSDDNPASIEKDIPINTWTKDFEKVGEKLDDFMNSLRIAIQNR